MNSLAFISAVAERFPENAESATWAQSAPKLLRQNGDSVLLLEARPAPDGLAYQGHATISRNINNGIWVVRYVLEDGNFVGVYTPKGRRMLDGVCNQIAVLSSAPEQLRVNGPAHASVLTDSEGADQLRAHIAQKFIGLYKDNELRTCITFE